MSRAPVRRAQLVAPFGVGAMMVAPDGVSLLTAGLDHWYKREDVDTNSQIVDVTEFSVDEWRLERALGVTHFRLPPDFRRWRYPEPPPNVFLTVPAVRFPRWHFCPGCHRLSEQPLFRPGRIRCTGEGCRRFLAQVPFVAMCDYGHLQDFPWREWVHRSKNPPCDGQLYLYATGGATLAAQKVKCDCGKERNLAGITTATKNGTLLSSSLAGKDDPYLCQGRQPWNGDEDGSHCDRPLRGSLRSASNLYFALVRSAIYLPRNTEAVPAELMRRLEGPPLSTLIQMNLDLGGDLTAAWLRPLNRELLEEYNDGEIDAALKIIAAGDPEAPASDEKPPESGEQLGAEERHLRRPEFEVLRKSLAHPELMVRRADLRDYQPWVSEYFASTALVDKLRETRVLTGFNRVFRGCPACRGTSRRRSRCVGQAVTRIAASSVGDGTVVQARSRSIATASFATAHRYDGNAHRGAAS